MEQDAHIEGALAAEASLVVLDTLETVVQADGGGGIQFFIYIEILYEILYFCINKIIIYYRCSCRSSVKSAPESISKKSEYICIATYV